MANLKKTPNFPTMGEDKVTGLSGTTYSTADGEQSVIPNPITTAKKVENKGMNDDALKMVKSYGDAFPMVQEPNAMQNPAMQPPINRAAAAPERGNLTNNVLPDQDAAKVSAANMGRDMKFNDIASSQGKAYPQPVPTTAVQTPQTQTFPKAGGMAAYGDTVKEGEIASGYANPKAIDNSAKQEVLAGAGDELTGALGDAAGNIEGMEGMGEKLKAKRDINKGNKDALKEAKAQEDLAIDTVPVNDYSDDAPFEGSGMSMYEGPEFNEGLKGAMAGKTGKFADMVKNAPGMYEGPEFSMGRPGYKGNPVKQKGPASFKGLVSKLQNEGKSKEAANKIAGSIAQKKMQGAGSGPTEAQKARSGPAAYNMSKPAEKIEYIENFDKSPLAGYSGKMNHVNSRITKSNVGSAKRDDKAHIDYLKRDIIYANKHGGSKKSMTNDEKHISKLAGDIKYDTYKKRKYDNI